MGSVGFGRRRAPWWGLAALICAAVIVAPAGAAQPRPSVEIAAESADGAAKGLTVPATGDKAGELTLPLLVREPGQLVVTWVDAANDAALTLAKTRSR